MASKMELVIQHALKTFTKRLKKAPEISMSELSELRKLTQDITVKDMSKLGGIWSNFEFQDFLLQRKTNLDYFSVYEDDSITIGVFLLSRGAKLPIHDHPNMYGILKVLKGIFKISSYTLVEVDKSIVLDDQSMYYSNPLKVMKHNEVLVTDKDQCCLLTPVERNIHEVECVEGPGAFLDILSPPYEEGTSLQPRVCHFFKEFKERQETSSDALMKLVQVPSPF